MKYSYVGGKNMFQAQIQRLLEIIHNAQYISPLLPHKPIKMMMQCEGEKVYATLSKQGMEMASGRRLEFPDVSIRGSLPAFKELFSGEVKLQKQIQMRKLFVTSSFRHALLLESIFYLCQERKDEERLDAMCRVLNERISKN